MPAARIRPISGDPAPGAAQTVNKQPKLVRLVVHYKKMGARQDRIETVHRMCGYRVDGFPVASN